MVVNVPPLAPPPPVLVVWPELDFFELPHPLATSASTVSNDATPTNQRFTRNLPVDG
jgi:hypothetical protein